MGDILQKVKERTQNVKELGKKAYNESFAKAIEKYEDPASRFMATQYYKKFIETYNQQAENGRVDKIKLTELAHKDSYEVSRTALAVEIFSEQGKSKYIVFDSLIPRAKKEGEETKKDQCLGDLENEIRKFAKEGAIAIEYGEKIAKSDKNLQIPRYQYLAKRTWNEMYQSVKLPAKNVEMPA